MNKVTLFFPLAATLLTKCYFSKPIPTSMSTENNEISLICGSERDLNDLVAFKFEPNNAKINRDVTWSCVENNYFSISGSTIRANSAGTEIVTATCVANTDLTAEISVTVIPHGESKQDDGNDETKYSVNVSSSEDYKVDGLNQEYKVGEDVSFTITLLNDAKEISKVSVNGNELISNNENYSFIMPNENVSILIELKDKESGKDEKGLLGKYNIKYDVGTAKTSKQITDADVLLGVFESVDPEKNIIKGITSFDYIFGGAYGRAAAGGNWIIGDNIKFGTTSVNGSLVLSLNKKVNHIKITGFVAASTAKIKVGDSLDDNKMVTTTCTSMTEITEETALGHNVSSMEISFEETDSLLIETTNKKPLYITAIEFSNVEEE